jgi:hypothetical protein
MKKFIIVTIAGKIKADYQIWIAVDEISIIKPDTSFKPDSKNTTEIILKNNTRYMVAESIETIMDQL